MSDNESIDSVDDLQAIIQDEEEKEQSNKAKRSSESSEPTTTKRKRTDKTNSQNQLTEEDKRLHKFLFGDKEGLINSLKESVGESDSKDGENNKKKRVPAWHDDDDEFRVGDINAKSLSHINKEKTYKEVLQSRFNRIVSQPKWADLDRKEEVDSDEELLRTVGHLTQTKSTNLPPTNITFKRLKDVNRATYAEGVITGVQFHPTSTVALVAGDSGVASIYSIDGLRNDKLHNVQFTNFPILCTRILNCGTEVLFGSRKKYFYSYDLMKGEETRVLLPRTMTKLSYFEISPCGKYFVVAGRFGEIHLMDVKSKELIRTYKQDSRCTALCFSNDSKQIFSHEIGPKVSVIDLRTERITHTFIDEGCINGKTLAISPNGKMIATGSNEGVVNIYNYDDVLLSKNPLPQKTIFNLTTSISTTKFNHSSEMLGICSDAIPGSLKLVHFPTGTVFANFPGFQANVGKVKVMEFSPNSGFMAAGNLEAKVPLFRLKHFNNY